MFGCGIRAVLTVAQPAAPRASKRGARQCLLMRLSACARVYMCMWMRECARVQVQHRANELVYGTITDYLQSGAARAAATCNAPGCPPRGACRPPRVASRCGTDGRSPTTTSYSCRCGCQPCAFPFSLRCSGEKSATVATSAPGLGSSRHICTGTGLAGTGAKPAEKENAAGPASARATPSKGLGGGMPLLHDRSGHFHRIDRCRLGRHAPEPSARLT